MSSIAVRNHIFGSEAQYNLIVKLYNDVNKILAANPNIQWETFPILRTPRGQKIPKASVLLDRFKKQYENKKIMWKAHVYVKLIFGVAVATMDHETRTSLTELYVESIKTIMIEFYRIDDGVINGVLWAGWCSSPIAKPIVDLYEQVQWKLFPKSIEGLAYASDILMRMPCGIICAEETNFSPSAYIHNLLTWTLEYFDKPNELAMYPSILMLLTHVALHLLGEFDKKDNYGFVTFEALNLDACNSSDKRKILLLFFKVASTTPNFPRQDVQARINNYLRSPQ